MDLTFTTWIWGDKYGPEDVLRLYYGVLRNTKQPFRFLVSSDRKLNLPEQIEQTRIQDPSLIGQGCFCRLRIFDHQWQRQNKITTGNIVNLDLDAIITDNIDSLFDRTEKFMILGGVNAANPNPFNCSVMMLRAGKFSKVWDDFSLAASMQIKYFSFPDDQGWIWHKLPGAQFWSGGASSGIYGFMKPGWPTWSNDLPYGAKIVAFIGSKKPQQYSSLLWIKKHWRVGL